MTTWILALALSSGLAEAQADDLGLPGFAPPVYDGVVAGAEARGLTDFRFLGGRDWPAIRLFAPASLDWSRAGVLTLPVENPADKAFRLLLRIDDRADANGDDRSLTGTIDIPPRANGTVILPLDARPIGMVARPPSGAPVLPGDLPVLQIRGAVDLVHVKALHVSGVGADADRPLRLGTPGFRAADHPPHEAIVDAFGQAIDGTWDQKVDNNFDLRGKLVRAETQTRDLAETVYAAADVYGGVDPGTRLAATGYFRVEPTGNRWSLVTPAGHRFFSLGVDSVSPSNPTLVGSRRALFASLPRPPDALVRYGVKAADGTMESFDVGKANLERGLGPLWMPRWRTQTLTRLKAWGFNTLGNWSSSEVTDASAMPFVEFYDVQGNSAEVPMPGGRALPDPFDPRFAAVADGVAAAMTAPHRGNPWLLGYFSGNELPWGTNERPDQGIAAQVLTLGPESPAKQALIKGLKQRYASAAAFTAAWGLRPATRWDDLLKTASQVPPRPSEAARRDIVEFQGLFATLYFRTVSEAIKRHDTRHLYLGTRFADAPAEVVEACARLCDVMSFNVYGRSPEERASAWRSFDRPVLIGEFHFGSTDRGSFWPGMVEVDSEADRAPAYAAYVSDAARDRQIIGCHWYQYADEPVTGRPYDGENGHIGLVAITDVPYATFVEGVAAANAKVMANFAMQAKPDLRGSQ